MTFYLPQFICPLCFFYSAFFFLLRNSFTLLQIRYLKIEIKFYPFLLKQVVVRVNDILQKSLPFAFDYSEFLLKPKHICTTTVKIKPLLQQILYAKTEQRRHLMILIFLYQSYIGPTHCVGLGPIKLVSLGQQSQSKYSQA